VVLGILRLVQRRRLAPGADEQMLGFVVDHDGRPTM
jgi:hypothetical protein